MQGHQDTKLRILASNCANNPGKHRVLTGGVCEMKIDFGPGYRVYYIERGKTVVVLLCGGDKSSQTADIKRALALAKEL